MRPLDMARLSSLNQILAIGASAAVISPFMALVAMRCPRWRWIRDRAARSPIC